MTGTRDPTMTEFERSAMRAWIMAVMDALNAAQSIASRGSEQMAGTAGGSAMHDLSVELAEFVQRNPKMLAARTAAHPRQ